jgi:hypothetical protein
MEERSAGEKLSWIANGEIILIKRIKEKSSLCNVTVYGFRE